jgi:hypothetical protein
MRADGVRDLLDIDILTLPPLSRFIQLKLKLFWHVILTQMNPPFFCEHENLMCGSM